jgi:hypothetical protein
MSIVEVASVGTDEELERAFSQLLLDWRDSVRPSTRLSVLLAHPAHQQIITLGREHPAQILPLILAQLRSEPHHWFAALREITGEDPAVSETTFSGCREAWLSWGKQHGFLT